MCALKRMCGALCGDSTLSVECLLNGARSQCLPVLSAGLCVYVFSMTAEREQL